MRFLRLSPVRTQMGPIGMALRQNLSRAGINRVVEATWPIPKLATSYREPVGGITPRNLEWGGGRLASHELRAAARNPKIGVITQQNGAIAVAAFWQICFGRFA